MFFLLGTDGAIFVLDRGKCPSGESAAYRDGWSGNTSASFYYGSH